MTVQGRSADELLDIVDEADEVIGQAPRDEAMRSWQPESRSGPGCLTAWRHSTG
jgi:hypothetical protein